MYTAALDEQLTQLGLTDWLPVLKQQLAQRFSGDYHGDFAKWQAALRAAPQASPSLIQLDAPAIQVGQHTDLSASQHTELYAACRAFHPWRKGPFDLFGIHIDTEWRSDWKWDRLRDHITPLVGRRILDIGCGSGYHGWRMRGAGAEFVLGLEPTLVYVMQFLLLQNYINDQQVQVLPLGIEEFAPNPQCFDTVFTMGLLYHRRDPQQHLAECAQCLREGGELILETLVIDDHEDEVLIPQGRYAQMRNVWAIPSVKTLTQWMQQAGYRDVRCVNVHRTRSDEQRSTEWMTFQSLADYLDPSDPEKTIEGYPGPRRAIMLATK